MATQSGTRRIGRYELQALIGEGAMAEVWRAYDPGIDRVIAIKLLKPEYRASPESAERFLREAKAAGALSHPAIVTIYDVGEVDGFGYIAMELLDGTPLDQFVAKGEALPVETVLTIGAQIAGALGYAHRAGVIHRDVKPSNIMLLPDKSVKLLDFGIARVTEVSQGDAAADTLRTQVGQVLGTPRYMSPEQVLGRSLDGRSDLFSVGVLLYELLTGRHAFDAPSAAMLALQITQAEPPALAELAPACPGGLRFIVEKLLAKRPERRFADGAELGKALAREIRAVDAVQAEDAARRRYLPLPVRITLAMVLLTAIGLAIAITGVLDRQYRAMEKMALASGSSIAAFVASNAALPAVDNAGLAAPDRDWLPVQAFIAAASKDESVRWMTMVDSDGIIRGSSDPKRIGTRYRPPLGEAVVHSAPDVTVTGIRLEDGRSGYRFVHPITYAGRRFGVIEVSIGKSELQAAAATSRNLLIALGVIVLLTVGGVSYVTARQLARPVGRLRAALRDAAMGNLDFRLSHARKDEFGELFDAYNLFAGIVQDRLESAERGAGGLRALEATRIEAAPAPAPAETPAALTATAEGTPFSADWRRSA